MSCFAACYDRFCKDRRSVEEIHEEVGCPCRLSFGWDLLRRLHHWRTLFEKATEMVATKSKAPTGSIWKCMYTCVIVKMRINFGSFGLLVQFRLWTMHKEGFWEVWILGGFQVKKFKYESMKNMGYECSSKWVCISESMYKSLVKEVCWWNVVYCMGVLRGGVWFLKIFRWGQRKGGKVIFDNVLILMWNDVKKFHFVDLIPYGYEQNEFPSCGCFE